MVNLLYVLIIGDRMFAKSNFITDRPKPKQSFTVLEKMIFICKNQSILPKMDEPVFAEIDVTKHAPLSKCVDLLLANGFRELFWDQIKEYKLHFLQTQKPAGILIEKNLEKKMLAY